MAGKKSYSVTLPVAEVKRLGWKVGDDLIVRRHGKQLVIEKDMRSEHARQEV